MVGGHLHAHLPSLPSRTLGFFGRNRELSRADGLILILAGTLVLQGHCLSGPIWLFLFLTFLKIKFPPLPKSQRKISSDWIFNGTL
jgi:hypothetical protein